MAVSSLAAVDELPGYDEGERPSGARVRGAKSLSEFGHTRAKRKRKGVPKTSDASAERARQQVLAMAESGDWFGATGLHLALLYCVMHEEVYGVAPLELAEGKNLFQAGQAAARLATTYFGGDYGAVVSMMRWRWYVVEKEREQWRRANGREGGRIGWRLQFSPSLVTDYKMHVARGAGR